MRHRLDVRNLDGDLFFYIDGSLQFCTADEHLYHESLVLPAAFISRDRAEKPINALVMGGGDGFCLRELLKVSSLKEVTLVDYDETVLDLARTVFLPWNKDSLRDKRVKIEVNDARDYLASTKNTFDLIIADFTFPASLTECELFTAKFFSLMNKRLRRHGVFALNTVSPSLSGAAYWSIFKTLLSLKMYSKPMHVNIPSFASHGYGEWGFFFGSKIPVSRKEMKSIKFPKDLKYLNKQTLFESMKFPYRAVNLGFSVSKTLYEPSDLLGFLNMSELWQAQESEILDFSYSLSRLKAKSGLSVEYSALMSEMAAEWEGRIANIFQSLDWASFLDEAEIRFRDMPKKIYDEFKQLRGLLTDFLSGKMVDLERAYQCFAVLMILMIFINMMFPDNAFAKGYHGHHSGGDGYYSEQTLIMPVAVAPFHNSAFRTGNLAAFVPDIKGKPHVKKTMRFKLSSASDIDEALLYALSDDIILAKSGQPYYILEGTSYAFKIDPDRFTLVESGSYSPLFEFYPDAETLQVLKTNLALQLQAADKAISDYNKWITWAGPARYLGSDVTNEMAELNNIKAIQAALSEAYRKFSGYKAPQENPLSSFKLAPSVYLTKDGAILFRQSDASVVNYPFRAFVNTTSFSPIAGSEKLDGFIKALLETNLVRLPKMNVLRLIIEEKMPQSELPK